MFEDPYKNSNHKYPLLSEEINVINQVWDFLKIFNKNYVSPSEYRKSVLRKVRKKYKIEHFKQLEEIAEKMFWNLRWLIYPLLYKINITKEEYLEFLKNDTNITIPQSLLLCEIKDYKNKEELDSIIINNIYLNTNYYRTFINKIVIINPTSRRIMLKAMEGSSSIFSKNYFNLLSVRIFTDRKLYEKVMKNPFYITENDISLPEFYFQYDYPFPNLNLCEYNFIESTSKTRLERIYRMYFHRENPERHWIKLMK
ncbi:MAG: hypothetical protein CMF62_04105 [Magnetococcales bacterium]|nr:hypothetical protein [Magnetococcales bacterium]|tara:strand:+ start:15715 stop:16479 length:765 start_codon:yes stop_codon:yes gene_type:complete